MNGRVDWDLLTMYVFGECSEGQKKEVEDWLAEDPAREGLLDDLREVYSHTGEPPDQPARDERRQEQTWAQVQAHMQPEADAAPAPGRAAADRGRASRRGHRSVFRVAAILAALAVGVVFLGKLQPEQWLRESATEAKVFVTQPGERATIRLADHTRVHLNAGSKLEVLPGFKVGAREVRLRGEAYFEVAADASRPFFVYAGTATTEVLGTKFAVNTYSGPAEVVVAEGKVAVYAGGLSAQGEVLEEENAQTDVILTSAQSVKVRSGEQLTVREVDLGRQLAWLNGEIIFDDAAFDEVARELERRYDIDVSLAGPAAGGQLTARFSEEQPLDAVLTAIASVFGLTYERDGGVVTFFRAGDRAD